MPLIEGASNFTVSGDARLYEIHGNAIINHSTDTNEAKKARSIANLPHAQASHKDYETSKKSGPCFPGTRKALLRDMMDWATESSESRIYVLSGLAGIGKSTVVYTLATQADELGLLGASFFFSRDEDDRNNAKKIFTTLAYQLCVYNETFSKAIGNVLQTERGFAAATQNPQEQLKILILDPLQSIVQSHSLPVLIVVDALDECDEEDVFLVLTGLGQLVRDLPLFKIILTTRPSPLDLALSNQGNRRIFHLQDIENSVVDSDIRLYLQHSLSLEEVQRRYPRQQWCASNEEIDSVVHAAGRLFIIASTAIRYIFDKFARNPASQMQKLLSAFAQNRTPFKDLDHFYSIILRNVIPENCDNDEIVSRYRSVVGAIISVQRPLPVSTLAHLVNIDAVDICAVLDNLQSVVLLGGDNEPHIYHKSFPDYLTDQTRCKDPHLGIDSRICHTQIAIRCFEIMDKYLKYNILGLGNSARFMSNKDGLKKDGITDEQVQERIPQQLRYACVYWVNHLEVAYIEDEALINGLEQFMDGRMLYWFEILSLIGKLDSAHCAIRVVLKRLKSISSDFRQLLSDALRFISKFYKLVEQSALQMYHSALPFTPTDSVIYRQYNKEIPDNICSIEGGSKKWDAFVVNLRHEERVQIIKFSLDSTLLVSCSERGIRKQGKMLVWDAATGTPISTIPGDRFAVANDFSTIASSQDNITTFYNVNGSPSGTMFTTSWKIQKLALSSESSRVAAALSDGTVWLWNSRNAELIDKFDGFDGTGYWPRLQFCPTSTRLAYSSANGIKLRDGISGRFIADLRCGSSHKLEFSGDGSRIASVSSDDNLTMWDTESSGFIDVVRNVGHYGLAISANGSLLATAGANQVTLWTENNNHLVRIGALDESSHAQSMAFSLDNILAIATSSRVKLYNVKTHSFVHTLFSGESMPSTLAFSPDCTRLAVGDDYGSVNLWDMGGIDASGPPSRVNATAVTALILSRDCSRLACGFEDGTVELWGTNPTKRRIGPLTLHPEMEDIRIFHQLRHLESVRTLGFDPDGRLFASGSGDGNIKLWNGEDGTLHKTFEAPGRLKAVALSNSVLVATWDGLGPRFPLRNSGVTLWRLDTLSPIHIFESSDDTPFKVSIADNSTLIAVYLNYSHVALLDVVNCTTIATFTVHYHLNIHTMTFLPDNSQLVVQSDEGFSLSFNLVNRRIIEGPTLENLVQLPDAPLWHGVPLWHCQDQDSKQHYFSALFSQHKSPVPVLWIPRDIPVMVWTQGSSMIALGCEDGRIILLRLPTSHVS